MEWVKRKIPNHALVTQDEQISNSVKTSPKARRSSYLRRTKENNRKPSDTKASVEGSGVETAIPEAKVLPPAVVQTPGGMVVEKQFATAPPDISRGTPPPTGPGRKFDVKSGAESKGIGVSKKSTSSSTGIMGPLKSRPRKPSMS